MGTHHYQLTEIIVQGHAAFKQKIAELENDPQSEGRPIFLIFKASTERLGGGLSWCPDVNAFEEKFRRLKRQMRLKGIILRVEVGDKHTWKSRRNPFRTDSDLRIDSVPTLINWRSGTSLSGPLTKNMEDLRAFFSSR